MSLLGTVVGGMQRTLKENKALRSSSRASKDAKEQRLSSTIKFEAREMTEEQKITHEQNLKRRKQSDQIRMAILWVMIFGVIGAFAYFFG